MRIRTTIAAMAAFTALCSTWVVAQQTSEQANPPASAASADSRRTVGGVPGVAPTPATASAASSPKLVRHNPGKGTVTQPSSAASAGAR